MSRQKAGSGGDPATRAVLRRAREQERQRLAEELTRELDVSVVATDLGAFRVCGYTAEDPDGVRRLVAKLKAR